jgi:ribose transport system permease protein
MARSLASSLVSRFFADYGMVLVLLLLCLYYSLVTMADQPTEGAPGGEALAYQILRQGGKNQNVLIVVGHGGVDGPFADELARVLTDGGVRVVGRVEGHPGDARQKLRQLAGTENQPALVAASPTAGRWAVLEDLGRRFPKLGAVPVIVPHRYRWPNFLKTNNLLNITNQITVLAILAIGMTLVIITGGIDLSVGSLIALSAVVAALLIRDRAGAENASVLGMVLCCLAAIVVCALVGLVSGLTVTMFAIPPFIATLAVMLMARGLASILAQNQSIYQLPASFIWLGRAADLLGIPNAVILMAVLYVIAHLVMTRMTLGRYLYAVGGNAEAARLSGVPVKQVQLLVYTVGGALAGLGGVVMASLFKSGDPTYGRMYELYVIAAVVVGGTSVSGGEGKVLGTLIGTLIIAVIQNGMNLTGVESNSQDVVMGAVILGAVLLDRLKKYRLG